MSSLRPTATAFVPSFSTSANTEQAPVAGSRNAAAAADSLKEQQAHQTQLCAEQEDCAQEGYEDEAGCYEEHDNWVQYDVQGAWTQDWQQHSSSSSSPWQEQQQQLGVAEQEAAEEAAEDTAWQYTHGSAEQAVQLLHSWFPSQPLPLLRQLLQACDGHLQEALQLVSEIDEQQQEQQQQQQHIRSLAHLTGSTKASTQPGQQQQELSLQDDTLFPALSSAATQLQQPAAASPPALHQAGSLWGGQAAARGSSSSTSSWSALAKAAAVAGASSKMSSDTPASTWAAASTRTSNPGISNTTNRRSMELAVAEQHAVPWVQTGEAVAQEYAAARAEASDHARVRNACFQQATQAYLAGNKALAKELSAKGKAAAQQMWAAHERASQQIYMQRNAQLAAPTAAAARRGGSSSNSAAVIDLHGLHVREVQSLLPRQLVALKQQKQQSVNVIVGTGHHTKGPPAARVGPAVEALLQGLGFSYKQPQPGLLRVQLA